MSDMKAFFDSLKKKKTAEEIAAAIGNTHSSVTHDVLKVAYAEAAKDGTSDTPQKIFNNMIDDDTIQAAIQELYSASSDKTAMMTSKLLLWVTAHAEEEAAKQAARAAAISPLTKPQFGISDTSRFNYADDYDLLQFKEDIDELFDWYPENDTPAALNGSGAKKYTAPCRPIIQSSGTGKTKLMYDFKDKYGKKNADDTDKTYHVVSFLCAKNKTTDDSTRVFDFPLAEDRLKDIGTTLGDAIKDKTGQDATAVSSGDSAKLKVVLMFDEAQHLLEAKAPLQSGDGTPHTPFESLRSFLRHRRPSMQIVAVYAGTSTSLGDCYPDYDERHASREVQSGEYKSGFGLYPPFFRLHTAGCLQRHIIFGKHGGGTSTGKQWTELEKALPYGRPLFARPLVKGHLGVEGKKIVPAEASQHLSHTSVDTISRRLLLDESNSSKPSAAMYASVWSSRVQLGSIHSTLADRLLKGGYIHLTEFFDAVDTAPIIEEAMPRYARPTATFTSCCEPLCAYLAMQLMNESSTLKLRHNVTKELSKKKWVEGLADLFSNRLCSPDRGDFGEIMSAVYLLFCADELRAPQQLSDAEKVRDGLHPLCKEFEDKNFGQISVPLAGFEAKILNEDSSTNPPGHVTVSSALNTSPTGRLEVSMMQFCRLEFNLGLKELSHQAFLKQMYESGCAHFLRNAYPLIDAVAAIRHTNNGTDTDTVAGATADTASYIPMLISVKTRAGFSKTSAVKEIDSIVKSLQGKEVDQACILIVVLDHRNKVEIKFETTNDKAIEEFFEELIKKWEDEAFSSGVYNSFGDRGIDKAELVAILVEQFDTLNSPASQEALLLATALTWINLQTPPAEVVTDALNAWAAERLPTEAAASAAVASGTVTKPELDGATKAWHTVCAQLAACHRGSHNNNSNNYNDCDVETDDVVEAYVMYANAIKDKKGEGETAGEAVEFDDLRAEFTATLWNDGIPARMSSGPCEVLSVAWQLSEIISNCAEQAKRGFKSDTRTSAERRWQRKATESINLPIDDCKNNIVSRIVYIPSDDAYGISKLIKKATCPSQATKIYSSFGQLESALAAAALDAKETNKVKITGKRSYNDLIVGRLDDTTKTYLDAISKQASAFVLGDEDGKEENDGDDDEEDK